MEPKKSLCFALALFLSSCMLFSEAFEYPPYPSPPYTFLAFTLQWPPSVCSDINLGVTCAIGYERRFTLSGLTPLPRPRPRPPIPYPFPPGCSGPSFNITKIEDIKPQLSKVWYDLVKGNDNDENIWKQAWNEDGKCSVFDQTDYFELALNIKNNRDYSVLDIVQSVGITPKESNPLWKYKRFYNAIYWRLGKRPVLECNINKYTKKPQLRNVNLCFENNGIVLIDCPDVTNCPDYFTWPTNANPPPPPPPPPSPPSSLSINNQ